MHQYDQRAQSSFCILAPHRQYRASNRSRRVIDHAQNFDLKRGELEPLTELHAFGNRQFLNPTNDISRVRLPSAKVDQPAHARIVSPVERLTSFLRILAPAL